MPQGKISRTRRVTSRLFTTLGLRPSISDVTRDEKEAYASLVFLHLAASEPSG